MKNIEDISKKIDKFKKDTKEMSQSEKLHYAIGYFKDCKKICELLCYIANYERGEKHV